MENKLYEIEQSAAAQQQRQNQQQQQARRQDVYNLDELSDAIANQPRQAAQQTSAVVQEEEKQVDYGDQFDYRAGAGRNTVAGNQPSAQAA